MAISIDSQCIDRSGQGLPFVTPEVCTFGKSGKEASMFPPAGMSFTRQRNID
jgi:hypothetical protein